MSVRQPCARHFYSGDCRAQIEKFLKGYEIPKELPSVVAGIVPHAGWVYSGAVAARVFKCISVRNNPATFILLGAAHTWKVQGNSIDAHGSWATSLGNVKIDDEVADILLDSLKDQIIEDPQAHYGEHSLEVQLPFIKYFFPDAKIVPITIIPDDKANKIGAKIGEIVLQSNKKMFVLGTTDLTHYGDNYGFTPFGYGFEAKEKMKQNDLRIIELAVQMKSAEIVKEAIKNHNACGSGAFAATVSAAKSIGANKGYLLEYTTSYDVMPEEEFHMAVGYAGIVFTKSS